MPEDGRESRPVPIEWRVPDSMVSQYVTNMVVQAGEVEFILSFFGIRPPIILNPPAAQGPTLEPPQSVPAECVARLIVAADRMPEFVKVLQENLQQYLSKKGKPE